ncbi:MAG: NADH-quinone oxidoreductase subunit NuoK [Blastocatellia bacterium]|nr:NADH-quinone oxidoreductase subunit NuoK [Blastocatellia bacterium]MBL8196312.1 NADH-quinone oxidoreductase subunit NuoK [Blastocatellia bacterium]MBN8724141.1 NADH-quinone oxidoreductase subunit NuoK [Acidobacteriota bacterium]
MSLLINFLLQTQEVVPTSVTERLTQGLFNVNINNFLVLSVLLFTIGVAGVLTRRNVIVIFMSIELILNAVNINLVAFSRYWFLQTPNASNIYLGEIFTLFVIVIAAAEAVIGLGIVIAFYRNRETISVDEIDLLKL